MERRPWAGTVSLSFTTQPALDFALSLVGAVDLAQAPLLGNALRSALHDCLAQQMTWPQRLELPLERCGAPGRRGASEYFLGAFSEPPCRWAHPLDAAPRMADGVLRVRLLCAQRLPAADMTGYSNAFVVLSVGDSVAQTAVRHQTLQPVWCEEARFSSATPLPLRCLFSASPLPLRCLSTASPLPLHHASGGTPATRPRHVPIVLPAGARPAVVGATAARPRLEPLEGARPRHRPLSPLRLQLRRASRRPS